MDRKEHLAWAKQRALEYVDMGDLIQAYASMLSDLNKSDDKELKRHPGIELGVMMQAAGLLKTIDAMRHWIEGFN